MGFREHFADGSVVYEGYICILDFEFFNNNIVWKSKLPLTIVTTDRGKALKLKKDFGYEIYSTDLKGITYD